MRLELAVGFLFLVAVALLGYMTSWVSRNPSELRNPNVYYSYVADSSGLPDGAAVRVAGIDVGRVKEKALFGARAKLKLEIRKDIEVREDARITVRSIGYLGDRYLDLDPGTSRAPVLASESTLQTAEGATFEGLMESGDRLLDSWTGVAERLNRIIGG